MNKQGPGKIDWTDWTWNPISGCKHGCHYCYMLRMANRFSGIMEPAFHPERLRTPYNKKTPAKIFAGSSGDMWGDWVDHEHIANVLFTCEALAPWHTYQFLTKNPKRYGQFSSRKNCWYGTTVDGTEQTKDNIAELVRSVTPVVRFVSFEPLLKPVYPSLSGIDWIIIGANSNRGADQPPNDWADSLIKNARQVGAAVWIKDNYNYPEVIKEFPII